MSKFREIWGQAILAGQEMMLNPQLGDRSFAQLLSKHAQDGMIFYERGEAFEYLDTLERAERDYAEAERLLPLGHWKAVAQRSLARVQHRRCPKNIGPGRQLQWDAFHDVHALPQVLHNVRVRALSALARIDSEMESALTDLRSCLEEVVVDQLRSVPRTEWPADLEGKIKLLESREIAPGNIVADMDQLRWIGNKAAHAGRTVQSWEVNSAINAFVRILRYFCEE